MANKVMETKKVCHICNGAGVVKTKNATTGQDAERRCMCQKGQKHGLCTK